MTTVIDLPDGNHATLLDSEQLTNRQVKLLRRAARKVGLVGQHLKDLGMDELRTDEATDEPAEDAEPDTAAVEARNAKALSILTELTDDEDDDLDLFQRTCAAIRLVEWSLDLPLPKTAEDVDNLPRPVYDALTTEAAKLDLNESFSKEASRESDDPKELPTPELDASS